MKKQPKIDKLKRHLRRKRHIRKSVKGTEARPRVSVSRTNKNIYAQIINDETSITLLGLGTKSRDVRDSLQSGGGNIAAAEILGKKLAEKVKEKGIKKVVFDRGGYRFHGRVKALAETLRNEGLEF